MTAYIDKAGMIARFGTKPLADLTDREQPYTGAIVDSVLDRAIASAGSIIDLHVGQRYALPLASVPAVLEDVAATLAFSALHLDAAPDLVTRNFDAAMRVLRQVADGSLTLPVPAAAGELVETGTTVVEVEAPLRTFTRDSMGSY